MCGSGSAVHSHLFGAIQTDTEEAVFLNLMISSLIHRKNKAQTNRKSSCLIPNLSESGFFFFGELVFDKKIINYFPDP